MPSKIRQLLLFAGLGAIAGISFGWSFGWISIQMSTAIVFGHLLDIKTSPARAAVVMGVFVAFVMLTGHWGATNGVEPSVHAWTIAIGLIVIVAHAGFAALTTFVAFRARLTPVMRVLVAMPALWVMREWLSLGVDFSVPWIAVGYAQAPSGPLAGLFPLGGVFLVSWASLVASAAIALAWKSAQRALRMKLVATGAAVVLAALAFGAIEWTSPSKSANVELLQSGVTSAHKFDQANTAQVLGTLARAIGSSDADVVVTSQLAMPKTIEALPPGYLKRIDNALQGQRADAIVGVYLDSGMPDRFFNGAVTLGVNGRQHYLKHDLLPFGEYLPLGPLSDWVRSKFDKPLADTARGPVDQEPVFVGGLRVALAICYESAFGEHLRRRAAVADAIVNLGSDSSIDSTQLARQFRQVDQARVLEVQKPLLRTSDIRGSFVLDAHARVAMDMPEGNAGSIKARIEGRTGLTPYARWGDALVLSVLVVSLAIGVLVALSNGRPVTHRRPGRSNAVAPNRGWPSIRMSSEGGQILPVSLALLIIVSGFFYLMINAGQAVTEKIRVTNAADAAAYSAGVVEARALNFDAYMNRGIVANQMAIAQMVSFASWIDYFAHAADNIAATASDIDWFMLPEPRIIPLEVAFGGSKLVAEYFGGKSVSDYAAYVIDGSAILIAAHDIASNGLALAEGAVQINLTAGVRQREVARQVVKAMDPKLEAEVVLVTHGFDTFTQSWAGDDRERLKQVAMRSRDQFTRQRNWTIDGFGIPFVRRDPSLKKRGGTELVGYDEWRGVDTLELHGERFGCGKLGIRWCGDIREPIGWGGIEVDAGGGDAGNGYHGNAYGENPTTADNSDSVMREREYTFFSGLPAVREIANVDPKNEAVTGITVRVWKKQADTLTSSGAATLKPSGELQVFDDHPAKGDMAALSRAQVFFDRISPRAGGKLELGSLYNPYWRVRLVAPLVADKAYAATKQGGLALP